MSIFQNNITFAILAADANWRTDLTIRFCEYYSHKLNGADFIRNIIFPQSVDDALDECTTEYLLIQQGGHIPFDKSFFYALEERLKLGKDIVLGNIELSNDYLVLDTKCALFDMGAWRAASKPAFASQVREGPKFKVLDSGVNKFYPNEIGADTSNERVFVPGACSSQGAGIVIRQIELYGRATSINSVLKPLSHHFLNKESPYHEIHSETVFEKQFLPLPFKRIYTEDTDPVADIKPQTIDLILAPAQGLKALNLVEKYNAAQLVIYDTNGYALILQRLIFEVKQATFYGDIVREFIDMCGESHELLGDWEADSQLVVVPHPELHVTYEIVDAFTYQIEDLIRKQDKKCSALIDFSDIYVWPYNYYRKPLYQVQGLFAEIYSHLKSRTGPTFILGYAPGYQRMDTIEVNTSTAQFERRDEEVEVFAPETTVAPEEEIVIPVTRADGDEFVPPAQQTPGDVAAKQGYQRLGRGQYFMIGQTLNATAYTKEHEFTDVAERVVYEYLHDEQGNRWSFRIGRPGNSNRVELMNGFTDQSLIEHINKDYKVNPNTVSKLLK